MKYRVDGGNSMKKILFIVESFGGGVYTFINEMANRLCDSYEVTILYAIRDQTPQDFQNQFDKRVNLIKSEFMTREIDPHADINAIHEIKSVVKQLKPDIVHLHSSKAGVLGRVALWNTHIPIVYTPHGLSFLMHNRRFISRVSYFLIEWFMARLPGTIVACSQGERDACNYLTRHVTLINNGIDVAEIDRVAHGNVHTSGTQTVVTLGRISAQKNPELFNEVAERLPGVHFIWVGDGELRDTLKSPNIQVTGWLSRNKALEICSTANIFLLCSRWEGLPLSLLEAMYLGQLCIVSNVVGNRDVITDGENGFVCDSVDQYTDGIARGITSDTTEIRSAAQEDVIRHYTIDLMSSQYVRLYQMLGA
jgi:glycosyltransferase involved in cell wall biosynthesis